MSLPFTREQFFDVFERYNTAVQPAQLVLVAIAIACAVASWRRRGADRAIGWALAFLWAWMGVVYHFGFFASINPAAWVFGAAFLAAAVLFAWHAQKGTLRFARPRASDAPALLLVAYALFLYPLIGFLTGHVYPRTPTFGLPCPTTIFTLGLLLLARRPVPATLFVVPLGWSVVGTLAALELGVAADFGLGASGAVTVATLAARRLSARGERLTAASR